VRVEWQFHQEQRNIIHEPVQLHDTDPKKEEKKVEPKQRSFGSEQNEDPNIATLLKNLKDHSWKKALEPEFKKPYFKEIAKFLMGELEKKKLIFPPIANIFNALNLTPLDDVKVVIIGQDPYHGAGQAHGLCFSVLDGVAVPPSLRNIYKELESDISGFQKPGHGNLTKWAKQGILLLNASLSVESGKANSHEKIGWQTFTDAIIKIVNSQKKNIVFILWGAFAQKKGKVINETTHCVLKVRILWNLNYLI